MIAIIDYGAGNLRSVQKAFEYLNLPVVISNQAEEIRSASHVILPGVGAFGDAMRELQSSGMDQVVRNVIADGKPFLGICVGLQLLFEESDESPGIKGLGIFRGKIRKIPGHGLKIPQMGWNSLHFHRTSPLLQGLREGAFMYFVHSYYPVPECMEDSLASIQYGETLEIAMQKENVFATQFHPEKSGRCGLQILSNFASL